MIVDHGVRCLAELSEAIYIKLKTSILRTYLSHKREELRVPEHFLEHFDLHPSSVVNHNARAVSVPCNDVFVFGFLFLKVALHASTCVPGGGETTYERRAQPSA